MDNNDPKERRRLRKAMLDSSKRRFANTGNTQSSSITRSSNLQENVNNGSYQCDGRNSNIYPSNSESMNQMVYADHQHSTLGRQSPNSTIRTPLSNISNDVYFRSNNIITPPSNKRTKISDDGVSIFNDSSSRHCTSSMQKLSSRRHLIRRKDISVDIIQHIDFS